METTDTYIDQTTLIITLLSQQAAESHCNQWTFCADDSTAAMEALAKVAAEPFSVASADSDGTFHHIVDHQNGHYLLKRLIINDSERLKSGQTSKY
jgi:hypothetical protein